jgi:diadenosine tetraphosphatase ApaH/serine/threonine PP2A family protein phosphatase
MRLALLADVHSNLEALVAVLAHAEREGADALAFLGDLVGYGADPGPVLERVQAEVVRGAVAVQGNHDAAVLDPRGDAEMNAHAAEAIAWTRGQLGPGERAFLASLPLTVRRGEVLLVHASAEAPGDWLYVTDPLRAARCLAAAGTTWVFAGHVHEPVLYYTTSERPAAFRPVPGVGIPVPPRRRWLGISGSVGQPRDGRPAASYAVFDDERRTLTFHRVAYDWPTAAAKVRAAGLPPRLAERLERGD